MLREEEVAAPMPQEATAYLNIARFHLYRGDLDDCFQNLEQALERCQSFNLTTLRGEIFEAYGNLYRERGDAPRASEFYERAARAYEASGVDISRTELLEEQALLALQLGNAAEARLILDRLVATRADAGDEMRRRTASLTRGRIMLAQREFEVARDELESSARFFREHHLYYYEAQASFALAVTALECGNEVSMISPLRRALDLAARYDYDYWLKREVAGNPKLLDNPDAAELFPADVRDQVRVTQAVVPAAGVTSQSVSASSRSLTDLTINMLGPVEILRDPVRPLNAEAWTTKRARDILCFIASRPHHRASKDSIIDTFWADADFEVVEKNFHPTVSHIRKALNSNQALKQNFLLYRDGDYQLNADFSYRVDIEEFDRLVQAGEAARRKGDHEAQIRLFKDAIALYRGEFMQGSYDDWVDDQRTFYSEEYLRLLETVASAAQKAGDWTDSLHLAQKILKADPYREDVHCKIMRAQSALGNRAAVKEQYELLRKLLRDELGVEPAADTQKIYRELMNRS
jgi:DNA-binding SARP family transcriptional activator